jgi:hypothetical protein
MISLMLIMENDMLIPKIAIDRMLPGMYAWQVFSDEEVMDEDYGDHTIEECLENAIDEVPPSVPMVEIVYCGFHMGTISTSDIRMSAEATASRILSLHGAFARTC